MKQRLSLTLFFALALALLAQAQFPSFPIYKVQLGYQTTADGLVYRSAGAPAYTPATDRDAWMYLDTVAGALYYYQAGWNEIETGGGADSALYVTITRLVDSLEAVRALLPTSAQLLPSGTSAQTLRHDGTSWVASTLVQNTETALTINPTSNTAPFQIIRSGTPVLSVLPITGGGTGAQLQLIGQTISSNRGLAMYNYANGFTSGPRIQFFRNRGTYAVPKSPQVGDEVGAFVFRPASETNPASYSQFSAFGGIVSGFDLGFTLTSIYFAAGSPTFSGKAQLYLHHAGGVAVGDVGAYTGSPSLSVPQRSLDVFGGVRIRELDADTATLIAGADADGDLAAIEVGSGLDLTDGVLTSTGGAPDSALYVTITHLRDRLEQLRLDLASLQALEDSAAAIRADFPTGGGGGYNAGVGTSLAINNSAAETNILDLSLPAGTLTADGETLDFTMPCLALNTTGATQWTTMRAYVDSTVVYNNTTLNMSSVNLNIPHNIRGVIMRTSPTTGLLTIHYSVATTTNPTLGFGRLNANGTNSIAQSIDFTCDWSDVVDIDITVALTAASPNLTFTRRAWNVRK